MFNGFLFHLHLQLARMHHFFSLIFPANLTGSVRRSNFSQPGVGLSSGCVSHASESWKKDHPFYTLPLATFAPMFSQMLYFTHTLQNQEFFFRNISVISCFNMINILLSIKNVQFLAKYFSIDI